MEERLDKLSARTGFLVTAGLISLAASLVAVVISMQATDESASRNDLIELREATAELKGELRRTSDTARSSEDSADTVRINVDGLQEDLGAIEDRQRRLARAGRGFGSEFASLREEMRELRDVSGSAVTEPGSATGGQSAQPVSGGAK